MPRAKAAKPWAPAAWEGASVSIDDRRTREDLADELGLNVRDRTQKRRFDEAIRRIERALQMHRVKREATNGRPSAASQRVAIQPLSENAQALFIALGTLDIETRARLADEGWHREDQRLLSALLERLSVSATRATHTLASVKPAKGRRRDTVTESTIADLRSVFNRFAVEPEPADVFAFIRRALKAGRIRCPSDQRLKAILTSE